MCTNTHNRNAYLCTHVLLSILAFLYCTALHYIALHYTLLYCTIPHYTTLHYTTLHYTTLHYTTLHYYTALYHTTLHLLAPTTLALLSYGSTCCSKVGPYVIIPTTMIESGPRKELISSKLGTLEGLNRYCLSSYSLSSYKAVG